MKRQSREFALQFLFQQEFDLNSNFESSFKSFASHFSASAEVAEYAHKLCSGVSEKLQEIDSALQPFSPQWKLSRMDKVDRNTLRIAAYELLYLQDAVPPKVVINEAIDIAKVFGNAESGAFINGILDQFAKSKRLL